ncbi:hypothetical protein HYV79_01015 [Candidatus Woesearchaeota archaeon]|nr:hypothetical protein [Candidatus Woesearchaeota archaeon]
MKGQITIFIILGLLIIFLILLSIYFFVKEQVKQPVDQSEIMSIKSTLQSCIEQATLSAFIQFLKQGGKYQVDSTKMPLLVTREPVLISNYDNVPFLSNQPPVYPWKTFPYNPETKQKEFVQTSIFGWNKISSLQQMEADLSKIIKEQLKKQCENLQIPASINLEDVNINSVFGNIDTIISVSGIRVKFQQNVASNIPEIKVRIPIAMKVLYNFIRNFIDDEVNDAQHKFQQENQIFSVITEKIEGHTLVSITDPSLNIQGVPFFFQFIIENRPPALFYIDQDMLGQNLVCSETKISLEKPNKLIISGGISPLISVNENELPAKAFVQQGKIIAHPCFEQTILLEAIDPDQDLFAFSIDEGDHVINEKEYQNLCFIPMTIRVSDGFESDFQKLKFRVKPRGKACPE